MKRLGYWKGDGPIGCDIWKRFWKAWDVSNQCCQRQKAVPRR